MLFGSREMDFLTCRQEACLHREMVRSNSHGIPQVSRINIRDISDRLERAETHITTRFLFMPAAPIQCSDAMPAQLLHLLK